MKEGDPMSIHGETHDHTDPLPEVDHHGDDSIALHAVRTGLEPVLSAFTDVMHDTRVVPEGQQWTVPIRMSCGFTMNIVFQMASHGTCPPQTGPAPTCPMCRQPVGNFKDALSAKEYQISGLCQRCQDEVFEGPDPFAELKGEEDA